MVIRWRDGKEGTHINETRTSVQSVNLLTELMTT
jgi:hypothetical protein